MIRGPRTLLALLTALNLLNYLDRFVLSAVLPRVQADLQFSNFVGGSLATVFLIGYFATSPVFGSLADAAPGTGGARRGAGTKARVGRRTGLIALGIVVWSLATIASGLVHTTGALIAARAFVGVGEASYAVIAPTLIDDVAPPTRKARWMAIFYAAIPVGSALGYVVGGGVEQATHSWRAAFFVAGVPGIVLALLCLLIAEPERQAPPPAEQARPDVLGAARELVRLPQYRATVLGYCAYTFALGGFAFWAPKYLHARYGLEPGSASQTFGLITVAGGAVGTLLGGWLGDRAARGQTDDDSLTRANLGVCAWAAGLGAPLSLAAILSGTAHGFFVNVFPTEIALFMLSGPVNVALLRSVPLGLRASAMALSIFAIHIFGDLWSPPLIGLVADHAPMQWAMLAAPFAFGLAAVLWWRGRASARLT